MSESHANERHTKPFIKEYQSGTGDTFDQFPEPGLLAQATTSPDGTNQPAWLVGIKQERRQHARNPSDREVICTVYDSLLDDFQYLDARVNNESESGLLLTTARPLETGAPVFVRLRNFADDESQDELKGGMHAEVLRCCEISSPGHGSAYQVALEFFEPLH